MTKQKKIMLLGGLRYLIPVIKAAQRQGYYVITADYLPDNIAHKFSDEYCNVSIIDKDAVLQEATSREIDGIMSFACDPGVISASYVQNKLGLPSFGPYESVKILQNKDKFRDFLRKHKFNVPKAMAFTDYEELTKNLSFFTFPIIVKPVDSAGSKGVSRLDDHTNLNYAFNNALFHSISKRVIIEEFIEQDGFSSDTDSFALDGSLIFTNYNSQRFDERATNRFTPASYSWPSTYSSSQQKYFTQEIQRLISLLGMKTSLFNIETRVGKDGKCYIMEFTPRGGGNRLSEMIEYVYDVDLITAIVRACVGDNVEISKNSEIRGNWGEIILHSDVAGIFKALVINDDKKNYIVQNDLWVKPGDKIECFEGANNAIGTLILNFPSIEELNYALSHQSEWLKVEVSK